MGIVLEGVHTSQSASGKVVTPLYVFHLQWAGRQGIGGLCAVLTILMVGVLVCFLLS